MSISSAAQTADFSTKPEKQFFLAPQTVQATPASTGFQSLHYVEFPFKSEQPLEQDREYGGDTSVDPGDAIGGDKTAKGSLTTRLCLNETGFALAYLLGMPSSVTNTHTYTSGKSKLPVATSIYEGGGVRQTGNKLVFGGLQASIDRGAAFQKMQYDITALDAVTTDEAALSGADAAPARLFVPKKNWVIKINDVAMPRVLSAGFNYSTDIQEDRYVNNSDLADDHYVGEPTCSVDFALRFLTKAQIATFSGTDTPFKLELIGTAIGGKTIIFKWPRVFAPEPQPEADGLLYRVNISGTAAKVEGGSPEPMMTVIVENSIAAY